MSNNHRLRSLGLAHNPGVAAGTGNESPAKVIESLIERNLDALLGSTKQEL